MNPSAIRLPVTNVAMLLRSHLESDARSDLATKRRLPGKAASWRGVGWDEIPALLGVPTLHPSRCCIQDKQQRAPKRPLRYTQNNRDQIA
ncbi:MAG TPA: hypothetical protein VMA74_03310 [Dyella sp.]|uniref:hypothetical protein n=1 Tax=Dyella sp. TaxID=1869338 RepID=UPI002BC44276|nr:hypothetical protein [Dyella sp.]HUB88736.1 hypothetical protein [Dyella sp.]